MLKDLGQVEGFWNLEMEKLEDVQLFCYTKSQFSPANTFKSQFICIYTL